MDTEKQAQLDQERNMDLEITRKRIEESLSRMLDSAHTSEDFVMAVKRMTDRLRTQGPTVFKSENDKQAFSQLLDKLEALPYSNPQDIPKEMSKYISTFLLERFSLEELENKLRESTVENSGWVTVNEVLTYDIHNKDLILHVPIVLTRSPQEALKLFEQGLHEIAATLKNRPGLEEVERVIGHSWLVHAYPRVVKRMGFDVGEVDDNAKVAFASINRGKFLERYS